MMLKNILRSLAIAIIALAFLNSPVASADDSPAPAKDAAASADDKSHAAAADDSKPAPAEASAQSDDARPAPADDTPGSAAAAKPDADGPKTTTQGPTAEQVKKSLLEDLNEPPVTEPNQREVIVDVPGSIGVPTPEVAIDPAALGVAPGQTPPPLRREGEFIVNRRGRLVRSPQSNLPLFVFDADTKGDGQELPMILLPCRLLQDMEQAVIQDGDMIDFIVSGQVYTYHGANYFMPTTMRPAIDRGNLE